METIILVVAVGLIQIAGMCIIAHMHKNFLRQSSHDLRTIAMFRKSRTVQDIAAMKSMGVTAEDWDKQEDKEEAAEEEDDGLMTADELSEETLQAIARSDGS